MSKKITFHDLARVAKVSPATVSRVAAGNPTVDPAIRRRVRDAAERLGLDFEERRNEKSRIIAFLLANRDVLHSFQARILLGAEKYCSLHNWELLFMSYHYSASVPRDSLHLPQLLSGRTNARAVILGGTNSANLIQAFREREIPFAVLGNNVVGAWQPAECDVVSSDDVQGAYDATTHLIAKGHSRIAYIGNLDFPWFARAAQGYKRALDQAGLAHRLVDLRSDSAELGYLGTKTLLGEKDPVTAIFAGSDQVAAGVYNALREADISVPGEFSVVGFNDTQGEFFHPALSTVREFPEELGRHLAEFVLRRLQNPRLPPQNVTIPTRLVSRDSVAVPTAMPKVLA